MKVDGQTALCQSMESLINIDWRRKFSLPEEINSVCVRTKPLRRSSLKAKHVISFQQNILQQINILCEMNCIFLYWNLSVCHTSSPQNHKRTFSTELWTTKAERMKNIKDIFLKYYVAARVLCMCSFALSN